MSLPQDVLKVTVDPESVEFLTPDSFPRYNTIKYERGGDAIGDGSNGLNTYNWASSYDASTGVITLTNLGTDVSTEVLTVLDIVFLDFSFDSNMRPVITYTLSNDASYFYWYNTLTNSYTTTAFPAGVINPVVTHDDKRLIGQRMNFSDAIIFYVLDDILYYLIQRERYQTPHQIATLTANTTLKQVGMCSDLRLRIQLENGTFISSP